MFDSAHVCKPFNVISNYVTHKLCMYVYSSISGMIAYLWQDGDCYTEAQCEAVVLCGNNHWIITPNLTRSIQIDLYLLLLKPQVFYLGWIQKQPVIQQLPSVRHTDEAQQGQNSCLWLFHLCLLDD